MSFVTERERKSIEELLSKVKTAADEVGLDACEPLLIFRRKEDDQHAVVTPIVTEVDSWEEALIRSFYRLFVADEHEMYWVGAVCESYGVVKDGMLLSPTGLQDELQPGELEKDFAENPFSDVTEGISVFLGCENGESEFFFYPFTRNDYGKAVFGKPWIRSQDEETDGISETEAFLLRFQDLLKQHRAGELIFDEEDE